MKKVYNQIQDTAHVPTYATNTSVLDAANTTDIAVDVVGYMQSLGFHDGALAIASACTQKNTCTSTDVPSKTSSAFVIDPNTKYTAKEIDKLRTIANTCIASHKSIKSAKQLLSAIEEYTGRTINKGDKNA